jgi:hypothetical protein
LNLNISFVLLQLWLARIVGFFPWLALIVFSDRSLASNDTAVLCSSKVRLPVIRLMISS